jgi:GNAT superfamily N-acetyltransferase
MESDNSLNTELFAPEEITTSPHWAALHSIILNAYKPTRDDWPLPKAFQRLLLDPVKAGHQLIEELGNGAVVAVAFENGLPVACAAVQKFRIIRQSEFDSADASTQLPPKHAISETGSEKPQQWELTLVTTSLTHRNRGIARHLLHELEWWLVREHGATELMVRTVDEISGDYWRNLGFEVVPEFCITLPKGMSHIEDAPDELRLERDVGLWTGRRKIRNDA